VSRPGVSVVIPTYQRAHLVGRAVSSAVRECADRDEVIVVDDGSTDGTETTLAPYRGRVVYVRVPNGGAGKARNIGVQMARNPLVAFLDSDDEWMPGTLDLKRSFMRMRPDVLFCFSDFAVRLSSGLEHRHYLARWHNTPPNWDDILGPGVPFSSIVPVPERVGDFLVHVGDLYPWQMMAPYVLTDTLVVQRERAGNALWFAEDLPTYEDWECFGRLARAGLAAYLDCDTAWQYGHGGPRLTDADALLTATARITTLMRVWGTDTHFLATHKDRFEAALLAERLKRVRSLIAYGRTHDARQELRLVAGAPLTHRLISLLPGTLAQALLALRRTLRLNRLRLLRCD
jgi:glycosyltransferase involved in cell wall biosynthesis